jgi:hypothetical protein
MNTLAREIMFRDAVDPSLGAAGNASLRFTPRHMISRATCWTMSAIFTFLWDIPRPPATA